MNRKRATAVAAACITACSLASYALLDTHSAVLALRLIAPLTVVFVVAASRRSN